MTTKHPAHGTNHPAHGTLSLDRLHHISEILSKAAAQSDGGNLGYAMADAVKVIDGAIAAFGAEPVADVVAWSSPNEERTCDIRLRRHDIAPGPLYSAPPAPVVQPVMFIDGDISASDAEKLAAVIREWDDAPAPERDQVRRDHAAWSQATFGNVGPVGPLKHLSKEAQEAAAEPGDLSEWADMQFLLWDAQRRAGISDEQINQAMVEKLAVNKQREWPEPKDGEPRLHIKEQPAPVVPEEIDVNDPALDTHRKWMAEGWNRCRAAILQAGNSPVAPDGWQLVPKEPTDEMNKAGWAAMNKYDAINPTYRAMLAAAPQQAEEPAQKK